MYYQIGAGDKAGPRAELKSNIGSGAGAAMFVLKRRLKTRRLT